MTLSGQKVYVYGRLRGITHRRIDQLTAAKGLALTRRPSAADAIVLAHSTVASAISDAGELRLKFRRKADAGLVSERSFRSRLGLLVLPSASEAPYSEDQIAKHAGLNGAQLRTLSLYDVLSPGDGGFCYRDLVAARAVGRLVAAGAKFPRVIGAALALEQRGMSLSGVRLAEAPWGELVQVLEGALAGIDGQLLLPLEGPDIDADEAFARAEAAEREGDLDSARRGYELAARLDESDAVIPFNLGNVLDELGRPREAEIAYRQAIARSPDLADAWFNLGVVQEKMGREEEALSSYDRAFAVEPAYADALHNAALLLMRKRRFAAALALLDRIMSASPERAQETKRLAHLCRLEMRHDAERA
jgi:tetratricopeptide (TPR) repeat protein